MFTYITTPENGLIKVEFMYCDIEVKTVYVSNPDDCDVAILEFYSSDLDELGAKMQKALEKNKQQWINKGIVVPFSLTPKV